MRFAVAVLALTLSLFVVLRPGGDESAHALTVREWSGKAQTPNWSNPGNWTGGAVPVNGDFIVFGPILPGLTTTLVNDMQGLSVARDVLYVADTGNHALRRIVLRSGRVETLCGNGRAGEPVIRLAVRQAMKIMGHQFVLGRTIDEALARSRKGDFANYRYSFDMLGEGALTTKDAQRYLEAYRLAIHAIG